MAVDVSARFGHLLSPGRIGTMELRNRIVMCPMGDNQATAEGHVTEQQMAYFEARAAGPGVHLGGDLDFERVEWYLQIGGLDEKDVGQAAAEDTELQLR